MGILIAAAIGTLASLLFIGGHLAWRSAPAERRILIILVLVQLPMSPLEFFGIRIPLDAVLESWSLDPGIRRLITFISRPVIEESIKLWPLLLPFVWKTTTPQNRVWRALAIGLGFGIGEIWLLAENVFRNDPATANMALWNLAGFINERVMVCLIHGALTAVALHQVGAGFLIAVILHLAGNLPFYLREVSAFGISDQKWAWFLSAWVVWYFFSMWALVWLMAGGDFHLIWLLFGDVTCPHCGAVYPRATINWSLRVIHHDHCPRCRARNEN